MTTRIVPMDCRVQLQIGRPTRTDIDGTSQACMLSNCTILFGCWHDSFDVLYNKSCWPQRPRLQYNLKLDNCPRENSTAEWEVCVTLCFYIVAERWLWFDNAGELQNQRPQLQQQQQQQQQEQEEEEGNPTKAQKDKSIQQKETVTGLRPSVFLPFKMQPVKNAGRVQRAHNTKAQCGPGYFPKFHKCRDGARPLPQHDRQRVEQHDGLALRGLRCPSFGTKMDFV